MVKVVIFDLDDTLISERQYIESGFRHVAQLLSNTLNQKECELFKVLIQLINISPQNVFNRLFEHFNINFTKEVIKNLVMEYRNHTPNIEFFDDFLPCLESLNTNNIKTGIITDGYSNAQIQKLKVIKAYEYFDKIIITDQLGKKYWKPHPKAFEIMKNWFDVRFNEMIYVGDNPEKDFYISNIYPIKTVRIIRENGIYNGNEYLEGIRENYRISTLKEIEILI